MHVRCTGLSDVLSYLREKNLNNFETIVVSVGINDLPELIGFNKMKISFYLQIEKKHSKNYVSGKDQNCLCDYGTKRPEEGCHSYPRKCHLHSFIISERAQL